MSDLLLDVRELETKFYLREGALTAVDRISFQLSRQETLGIVGESGCGKSVLAKSLIRLVPHPGKITHGQILYRGNDLLKKPESEMRTLRGRRISMISQEPTVALNPSYTVAEQVAECYMVHSEMGRKEAYQQAESMLARVGISNLGQRLKSYPHEFSGGMLQRVMIAMALACDPDILIADEPTTALDVTIQAQILDLLHQLLKQSTKALIFITHDLGVAAVLCDRIAVMYAGSIVELRTSKSLFERPLHPYTQGLLRALPRRKVRRKLLEPIPGTLCSLMTPPDGCRFHPRCEHVMDICSRECPSLCAEEGGSVACHLYSQG